MENKGLDILEEAKWKVAGQRNYNEYYSKLYDNVNFNIHKPILDIGGGCGSFLKYLKIEEATIMDLAGQESLMDSYQFIKADVSKKLPPTKLTYKTIFVMETLEHLDNPLYLMAQVYDLLDKDGKCYVAVPFTKLNLQRTDGLNSHVNRWFKKDLEVQLKNLGFKVKFINQRRWSKDKIYGLRVYVPPPLPHLYLVAELTK